MAGISTNRFDVVAHTGTDSPDMVGHGITDTTDVRVHSSTDSPDMVGHGITDTTDVLVHSNTDAVAHLNADVVAHPSTDPNNVIQEHTAVVDHASICYTVAVDHAYTESTGVFGHAHTVFRDSSRKTTNARDIVCCENTEVVSDDSTSDTDANTDVGDRADIITSADMFGFARTSSADIVDHAYTDSVDVVDSVVTDSTHVVDNVDLYSTNVVDNVHTYSTNVDNVDLYSTNIIDQADTFLADVATNANTDSADAGNHAKTDPIDDLAVHAGNNVVKSAVKDKQMSGVSSLPGRQKTSTLVTIASVPDMTPSRRSSRKKQSTFSSDFEYYALGNMKIEVKSEPTVSYKPKQTASEAQDDDSDEQSSSDDDVDEDKMTKSVKKKIAEKKHKGKFPEASASDEDEAEDEVQFERGKVKVAVKKKALKLSTLLKSNKKKKIKMEEEKSEVSEDSDEDMNENKVTPKFLKGHKRKQDGGVMKVECKKVKVEADQIQEDESSDEEESTPISLLKAKLKEEATPISQLKDKLKEESIPISKLKAELKEESIPISQLKAKLKDSNPVTQQKTQFVEGSHPAFQPKIMLVDSSNAFSQLQAQIRLKREAEKKAITSSSQGRSLMERLADGTLDLSVDYDKSRIQSQKRKHTSNDGSVTEEVPSKIPKSIQIDKLAPALANLVKRLPPPGHGQAKSKPSSDMASPEAAKNICVSNNTGFPKSHPSSAGNSAAGSSQKQKVKNEGSMLKKSVSVAKKTFLDKTGVSKTDVVEGDSPKRVKERKSSGGDVKLVPNMKEVRHVTKVKVIRKPDGTIIKKKILVPERDINILKESKVKVKSSHEKSEHKKAIRIESIQTTDSNLKPTAPSGKMSNKKHNGKLDSDDIKKKNRHEFSSKNDKGLKHKHGLKAKVEHDRKHDRPNLTVDDLLKRGVYHKKKRHQPFGNKNLLKPAGKDLKSETVKDSTNTEQMDKESTVHKKGDKLDMNKMKGKKSSDVHKKSRDRSHSSDSGKGMRKKSMEFDRKKIQKRSDTDNEEKVDGPPVLTSASSVSKPKHRHHKVEHEVCVDMTMNDLFKPDTQMQDQLNNEELDNDRFSAINGKTSQYSDKTNDVHSYMKPEHLYNIMIEHQYSKPTSPVMPSQDGQLVDNVNTGRDDDIESISHVQTVIMDVNLPDQFLEESDDPVVNNADNFQDTWPDTRDELLHLVDRRDTADRPSILESLGSELKESGTEFLIVGQVEVGRVPVLLREERQFTQLHGIVNSDNHIEPEQANASSTDARKASVDVRKASLEKSRDSTDRKTSSTDSERRSSTKDKKSSSEDRKSSSYDRKSSSDRKHISGYKKSGSEDKNKNSSEDKKKYSSKYKKKYSSDDRRKSSSDDRKKSGSDNKKSSSEKKASHEDKRKSTDAKNDSMDRTKHKDNKKTDNTERKPENVEEMDDDSGEEQKFKDDENDIDWEPNDTDTLYCICRKPHSNRFMICCDKCEEWFHGTCVGVSRARGKEMEENEEEYICPFCSKGDHDSSIDTPSQSSQSPDQVKSKLVQKCVGRKCSRTPRSGSVYCSNECVMSHAQEALKAIRDEDLKLKQTSEKQHSTHSNSKSSVSSTTKAPSSKSSSLVDTVEVIERETGKLLTGPSAPTQKGLHRWLEQHPTFEVVLPHKHRSKSSSSKDKHSRSDKDKISSTDRDRQKSDKDRKRAETDKRDHTSSKDSGKQTEAEKQQSMTSQTSDGSRTEDKRDDGQKQIRVNVQTALADCLAARAQEDDDIMLSSNEIKNLAVTIEEELFSLFSDTGHKYRAKYRSLVFNIKDQKNKGLFRKILTGKIKPYKLVQMSTEELASRELAKWREQASKHQLDMIQKTEQQALKESQGAKHMRKKTHKGEVEVEEEDLSILETRLEEKKDVEPEPQEELPQIPMIDTTEQHRAHLFDLNCKVCTGKIVPGREDKLTKAAAAEKPATVTFEQAEEKTEAHSKEDKDDYDKAEEIVKEALRTMQKMEKSVSSMPKLVSSSLAQEAGTPPLSPKLVSTRRESSSSSASSMSSSSTRRKVVVRSPDSALQSGLEAKSKFTPTGPMLWKGFMSMLDVAKFFTSAYRVSGPTDHITIPDTISILGRISPEHMWDYLSKIRQAGSKDLTIVRFIPGNDDEKVAYVNLYSYLNSRGRCGVAANSNKQIKDFYIIPLASHSKIPRTLLPFDGPGLEENRPHMLIGILVRQRGKHATDTSDTGSSGKSGSQNTITSSGKSGSQRTTSSSVKPDSQRSAASSSIKRVAPVVNRDPRLAKMAAREASPKVSPAESAIYVSSSSSAEAKTTPVEEYEPEYVPMPVNSAYKPVAEYIPTPTVKKKHVEEDKFVDKKERIPQVRDSLDKSSKARKEKYRHRQEKQVDKKEEIEDDSDPYSPGKEAEPYSPGQEAAADEPYDPADDGLMNESDVLVISSMTVSSSTATSSVQPAAATAAAPAATENPVASVVVNSSLAVAEPSSAGGVTASVQKDTTVSTRELVEKMARSNDPQEISAFMVMALSSTSSATEQQRLLVELTSKVEERKLQLAETARSGLEDNNNRMGESEKLSEGGVSSSSTAAGDVCCVPSVSQGVAADVCHVPSVSQGVAADVCHVPSVSQGVSAGDVCRVPSGSQGVAASGRSTPTNIHGSLAVGGAVAQTVSSSVLLPSSLPASVSTSVTASEVDTSETEFEPKLQFEEMSSVTKQSQDSEKSVGTADTHTASESSGDIPDALRALINDVMGNTHVSSLEMRRRMVLKKEVQKVDVSAIEVVKEDRNANERQLLDKQAETQKRLMDEAEALKILETVKKLEQAGGGVKLEQTSNNMSDGGGVAAASTEVVDTHKETPSIAPSVDELLEKLKRGGFQFPTQKADNGGPSSSSVLSTLVQPSAAIPSDNPSAGHSDLPATTSTTQSSLVPTSFSSSAAASSFLSSVSALDMDFRQKDDLPGSPAPVATTAAVTSSTGSVDSKATEYRDYNTRMPSTFQNQDDSFYQDRDDRLYRPPAPPAPKHPLDPYAFPPLPGKSHTYLPPPRSNLPLPLGPLHPRFPLPSTDPHTAYHPTPTTGLRPPARAQPPPPGTESEKLPGDSGFVDDLPASDVDFWSRSRASSSQDHLSPPQPVPPPAPLPPLPGNRGSRYSDQVPGDVDLRGGHSFRPPQTHHTRHHGRGGDRPYQRR